MPGRWWLRWRRRMSHHGSLVKAADLDAALELLWQDLMALYHEASAVTIVGKDGVERPYRPTRYLNEIRRGRAENTLVPTVARIIRRPTTGLGILVEAGRRDLLIESRIVLDESKPYHHLWSRGPKARPGATSGDRSGELNH